MAITSTRFLCPNPLRASRAPCHADEAALSIFGHCVQPASSKILSLANVIENIQCVNCCERDPLFTSSNARNYNSKKRITIREFSSLAQEPYATFICEEN
jgi:hypothetical protein